MTLKLVIIIMVSLTYFHLKFGSSKYVIDIDVDIQFDKPNAKHNISSQMAPVKLTRSRSLTAGCTVFGYKGDGTKRGTCKENFLCHEHGNCKPICTVLGSKGDGISRGSCPEGRVCFRDGTCKISGHYNEYYPVGIAGPLGQASPVGPISSWSSWSRFGHPQWIPHHNDYGVYGLEWTKCATLTTSASNENYQQLIKCPKTPGYKWKLEDNNGVCAQTANGLVDWELPHNDTQKSLGYYLDIFDKNGSISPTMHKTAICGIQSGPKWKDTTAVRAKLSSGPIRVYYKL